MRVAVVGLGYVGLPVACAFARAGHEVVGFDIDAAKVSAVRKGRLPVGAGEPGLAMLLREVLSKGALEPTTDASKLRGADAAVICVDTPLKPGTKRADLRAVRSAATTVGRHLDRHTLVSVESTLPPGTMHAVVQPTLEKSSRHKAGRDFYLVYAPERLAPGRLLFNLEHYDRVIGGEEPEGLRRALELYGSVTQGELHPTDWRSAEVTKTAENAYWDNALAFANEVALLCEKAGVDFYEVRELVNTCPGRDMPFAGAGVGGSCLPKDPWFLRTVGDGPLIPAARAMNESMPLHVANLAVDGLKAVKRTVRGAKVVVLGAAYKGDTDDTRYSPGLAVAAELKRRGARVVVHDPHASTKEFPVERDLGHAVKGADCIVVAALHGAYGNLHPKELGSAMRTRVLVDGRNLFNAKDCEAAGFVYRGLGKGR